MSIDDPTLERLARALEDGTPWPRKHIFKFIVPLGSELHLRAYVDGLPYTERRSRTGRYVAITVETEVASSEEVVALYRRVSTVKGLLAF